MSDSKKKRRSGLEGTGGSTVSRLIGESQERQHLEETRGRGKPGHAGQVGRDSTGRSKATFDIALERQAMVDEMATAEDVAKADIVEAAIVALYNAWKAGEANFYDFKEATRSLRAMWKLTVPDDFSLLPQDENKRD